MSPKSKEFMLDFLDNTKYPHTLTEDNTHEEIKAVYSKALEHEEEINDLSDLFPNGYDYDEGDEDFY